MAERPAPPPIAADTESAPLTVTGGAARPGKTGADRVAGSFRES